MYDVFMQVQVQVQVQVVVNIEEDMAAKVEEIFKRFGDEQSTLLDQYERLSFEVQLNKAMLGRSLSEPAVPRLRPPKPGRRKALGFQKVMKKLFSPILWKKGGSRKDGDQIQTNNPFFSKNLSRSLRV